MFGLFKRKDPHKEYALELYKAAMIQSRDPWFYESAGVPDSYDGRFDNLLLHLYLIIQRLNETPDGKALAQELFDTAVGDFDQSLREIGVGDTGMKRRMKNMMLAFNGRMHVYQAAKDDGSKEVWAEVLERNLYGTLEMVSAESLEQISVYVLHALRALEAQSINDICQGALSFPDPEKGSEI